MNDNRQTELPETKNVEPLPIEQECELLDWDAYIPAPPPKRRGTIQVQLHYKGRAKPLPVADPEE